MDIEAQTEENLFPYSPKSSFLYYHWTSQEVPHKMIIWPFKPSKTKLKMNLWALYQPAVRQNWHHPQPTKVGKLLTETAKKPPSQKALDSN
jgi:hypothetical protein